MKYLLISQTQYMIITMATTFLCAAFVSFYYIIIQPARHEKIKNRQATKKEIDDLFDSVDPFCATEAQGIDDSEDFYYQAKAV